MPSLYCNLLLEFIVFTDVFDNLFNNNLQVCKNKIVNENISRYKIDSSSEQYLLYISLPLFS